jgi:transcriptional/translational regulatory protein YebC/TACO1
MDLVFFQKGMKMETTKLAKTTSTLAEQIKEYLEFIEEVEYNEGELTPYSESRLETIMANLMHKTDACKFVLDKLEQDEDVQKVYHNLV